MVNTNGVFLNHVQDILVVGVGGIGSWVLEPLTRMLLTNNYCGRMVIMDDDKVELKNLSRQGFNLSDVGQFKVSAWHTNRLMALVMDAEMRVVAHPTRLDKNNVDAFVKEHSLVILCPDNHAVRALVAAKAESLRNVTVLTSGNELFNGNTHVLVRRNGVDLTAPMREKHPEVFQENTETQMAACTDLIDKGNAQILMTNFMAATSVLLAFHQLVSFHTPITATKFVNELPHEVYFNALTGKMRTQAFILQAPIITMTPAEGSTATLELKEVRSVLAKHSVSA